VQTGCIGQKQIEKETKVGNWLTPMYPSAPLKLQPYGTS